MLGLWALSRNRPGNFDIRPTPREGGHLVQQEAYRWIRHPTYTAVIACGLAIPHGDGPALRPLSESSGLCDCKRRVCASRLEKLRAEMTHRYVNQCALRPGEGGVPAPARTAQPGACLIVATLVTKNAIKDENLFATRM